MVCMICVCIFRVWVWAQKQGMAYMWRSENNLNICPGLPIFWDRVFCCSLLSIQASKPQDFRVFSPYLLSCCRSIETANTWYYTIFVWDLGACTAHALPTEPPSLPQFVSKLHDVCGFRLSNCAGQTTSSALNHGDLSRNPCLDPDHRGKLSSLSMSTAI